MRDLKTKGLSNDNVPDGKVQATRGHTGKAKVVNAVRGRGAGRWEVGMAFVVENRRCGSQRQNGSTRVRMYILAGQEVCTQLSPR